VCGLLSAAPLQAQLPKQAENLQVIPKDITMDSLTQIMRSFSFALGVRCQYCHTGGDGISFEGVVFKSDEKPAKRKARYMLQMVDQINNQLLARLESKADPAVNVRCVTCHRGSALPKTLEQVLAETIQKEGIPAAVQRYKELRENTMPFGKYDFGEWSINELGRKLAAAGDTTAAIAIYEMNQEYYPRSSSIDMFIGELHRLRADTAKAIDRYRKALEKDPNNQAAKARINLLTGNR
jgi:tetratricopeptide (TPR) repeat protein